MRKKTDNELFKLYYSQLKGFAFKTNDELAKAIGYKRGSSITEILQGRQMIQPDKFARFTELYRDHLDELQSADSVDNVDYYKDKIIELQEDALRDKQQIIELQRMLLDKSSTKNPNTANDPILG